MQVLQEKAREKTALLEKLCQTQVELLQTRQQLGQRRQEAREERENGQVSLSSPVTEGRAVTRACKVDVGTEEGRTTAGKSQQVMGPEADQDLSEAQELSRQKVLEAEHLP